MTEQEQGMLQDLVGRVNQTVVQDKDPEAAQFLQQALGRNPDALYILAQTVLVQQYGLDQAKKQMDDLRNQAPPPPPPPVQHKSFLGSLLGTNDSPPAQQQYAPVQQYGQPPYAQQPQYGQPQYTPQYGQPQQSSFLGSAMRTATGVAAGALAFEGIESLFHGFGGGGQRSNFGEFGGGREEVVNNYYGDSDRGGMSRDVEDRRGDSAADTSLADNDPDDFADTSASAPDDSLADNDPDDFGSADNS